MDRLLSMRVFQKVIDEGGFASAARSLDMSSAVVTRLVADLEKHLGTRLLHRTTRRLQLTPEGDVFFRRARGREGDPLGQVLLDFERVNGDITDYTYDAKYKLL